MREVDRKGFGGVRGYGRRGGVRVGLTALGLLLSGCIKSSLTEEDVRGLTNKFLNPSLKSSLTEVAGQKLETLQFEFEGNLEIADDTKFLFRDEKKVEVRASSLSRVYEDGRTKVKAIFDKGVVSKDNKVSLYYLGEKAFKFTDGTYSRAWTPVNFQNELPEFTFPNDVKWFYNLVTGRGAVGNFIATDADSGNRVDYRLEGDDAELFRLIVNAEKAVYVSFRKTPDPYNPTDKNKDGDYEVSVVAFDNQDGEAKKGIEVDVLHRGGNDPYVWVLTEGNRGSLRFYDGSADTSKYTLKGEDASFFEIVGGALRLKNVLSFSDPKDQGGNNIYEVTVVKPGTGRNYESYISVRIVDSEGDTNRAPKYGYKDSDIYDTTAFFYSENISIDFVATDPDGDKVSYTLKGADGSLFNVTEQGNVTFRTPPIEGGGSFGGHYLFTVVASDDKGGETEAHAIVFVNGEDNRSYDEEVSLLGWGGIIEDIL